MEKEKTNRITRHGYTLTLTRAERDAFAWIGGRYAHGSDMLSLIWKHGEIVDPIPEPEDMDDPRPITFLIPEFVAWLIRDLVTDLEDDPDGDGSSAPYMWECFSDKLAGKMQDFIGSII